VHRVVTDGGAEVRLLDIQINPGDMTLPHTHDAAILYTFISNGDGPLGGRVSSTARYVDETYTHRVSNPGPGLFRIIALTSYAQPVTANVNDTPQGLTQEPDIENGWFRAWRLTLTAGEETAVISHNNPAFVVHASSGAVHVRRGDGLTELLRAAGDWSALESGQRYTLVNRSHDAVTVVIKEARVLLSPQSSASATEP
jgi:uncharacterized RmlC-like cupin family protein